MRIFKSSWSIGYNSGSYDQGQSSLAIGINSGFTGQSTRCVSPLALNAGYGNQGQNAISICRPIESVSR